MRTLLLSVLALVLLPACGAADELAVAAGAAVGGCALLDTDDDDTIERDEVAVGLFARYDTDGDGALTEAEFEAGAARGAATAGWSGEFDEWDADGDGVLTRAEFTAEATDTGVVDATCDDLGL